MNEGLKTRVRGYCRHNNVRLPRAYAELMEAGLDALEEDMDEEFADIAEQGFQ